VLAAFVGERGEADESGDLLSVQGSELGQFRDERTRDDGADAGHALEERFAGSPDWTGLNGSAEIGIDTRKLALQPADMLLDGFLERCRCEAESIALTIVSG